MILRVTKADNKKGKVQGHQEEEVVVVGGNKMKCSLKNFIFSLRESTNSLSWIIVEFKIQNGISLDPLVCKRSPKATAPVHGQLHLFNAVGNWFNVVNRLML